MAGERRYIGIGQEAVFGAAVPADAFLDFVSAQMESPSDEKMVFEGSVNRALQIASTGPYVPSGSIEIPLDLDRIGYFTKWLMGNYFTVGTPDTASTTLASAANKGDTTIVVNSETGFTINDYVQLENDPAVSPGDEPEVVQIQALDGGAGPTYSWTVTALQKDHASGRSVLEVVAPYIHTHWQTPDDNLPSFTLRVGKNVFEHVFAGCTIGRTAFSMERGFVTVSIDLVAQKDSKAAMDISSKSLPSELLTFRNGQTLVNADLTGMGAPTDITANMENYTLEINNNIDEQAGVRHGSRFPREFFVGGIDVSGTARIVFKSDAEYVTFWGDPNIPQEGALTELIFEERFVGLNGNYLALLATKIHYTEISTPVQGRDRITQEVSFRSVDNANFIGPVTINLRNDVPFYVD